MIMNNKTKSAKNLIVGENFNYNTDTKNVDMLLKMADTIHKMQHKIIMIKKHIAFLQEIGVKDASVIEASQQLLNEAVDEYNEYMSKEAYRNNVKNGKYWASKEMVARAGLKSLINKLQMIIDAEDFNIEEA